MDMTGLIVLVVLVVTVFVVDRVCFRQARLDDRKRRREGKPDSGVQPETQGLEARTFTASGFDGGGFGGV